MHTIRLVVPYPSNPTTPSPSHCLDTVISSLDSLASVVADCEWSDGVKRWVSEWRRENSFESDRCVSVIVHRGVVQWLDSLGVMVRVRGRTWSARILWLLQISSLSLYIEMPLAHAKPNANDVIRVPNIFLLLLFFLSLAIGWSLRRLPRRYYFRVPRGGWVRCDRRGWGVDPACGA